MKIRVHAQDHQEQFIVGFQLSPEEAEFEYKDEFIKEVEKVYGMPAQIDLFNSKDEYLVGSFEAIIVYSQLLDIYQRYKSTNEVVNVRGKPYDINFYAENDAMDTVDIDFWPKELGVGDEMIENDEYCTCGGPGKGFTFGRKDFVTCKDCGKSKAPGWTGDFERVSKHFTHS